MYGEGGVDVPVGKAQIVCFEDQWERRVAFEIAQQPLELLPVVFVRLLCPGRQERNRGAAVAAGVFTKNSSMATMQ